MDTHLGSELPQRGVFVWAGLGIALCFIFPLVSAIRKALSETEQVALAWGVVIVMAALLVATPLAAAGSYGRKHVFVSDDAVTVTRGSTVTCHIPLADMTAIRVIVDGGLGPVTPEFWNQAVLLQGPDGRWTKVSRTFVTTLTPLLERLAPYVERRPGLIADDQERKLFHDYLAEA
jgi:hypothetical protein